MPHLEGVISLVSGSGPWFRIQGRHLRPAGAKKVTLRLIVEPQAGLMVDLHLGESLWVRAGWYPSHLFCAEPHEYPAGNPGHRCWAKRLPHRVFETGR